MQLVYRNQVLALRTERCENFSDEFRLKFFNAASFLMTPDKTLKNLMRPANGSFKVLKDISEAGWVSAT